MAAAQYQPQAGTFPARVVEHLLTLPQGTELTTAQLQDVMDCEANTISGMLAYAVRNHCIVTRKAPGEVYSLWSLAPSYFPSNEPGAAAAPAAPEEQQHGNAQESAWPVGRARRQKRRAPTPKQREEQPLECALWNSGQLDLRVGGIELQLTPEQTRTLCTYLDRLAEHKAA